MNQADTDISFYSYKIDAAHLIFLHKLPNMFSASYNEENP